MIATRPGDIIQLDTVDSRPAPGVVLNQFTAVDVVSRFSVALLARDATASAKRALAAICERMPFSVRPDCGRRGFWFPTFAASC